MQNVGYYNGIIDEVNNLTVPFLDRACFFGDGVYDACYCKNSKVFTLDEHLRRFFFSAKMVDIVIPLEYDDLKKLIISLAQKVEGVESIVYFQLTRGTGMRKHSFPTKKGNLWISITPKKITDREKRFNLTSVVDNRYLMCNVKTLNLLPNVLASNYAEKNNCDEAVFIRDGFVTECAHSNIHLLKNNVLFTAPCDEKILAGIARSHLITACKKIGISVKEQAFSYDDILTCDELIVTSAGTFCTPCSSIDGKKIGGNAPLIINLLQTELYNEYYEFCKLP